MYYPRRREREYIYIDIYIYYKNGKCHFRMIEITVYRRRKRYGF